MYQHTSAGFIVSELAFQFHIVAQYFKPALLLLLTYFSDYFLILSQISFSSMEVGIVPDNTRADVSNTNILRTSEAMELSGQSLVMPVHFSSMDREARVLRYKEKKQARTFQKTIRYATRKAYAEARPRIKGRFAKRSDTEHEVDHMLTTPALPDSSHGTIPWF